MTTALPHKPVIEHEARKQTTITVPSDNDPNPIQALSSPTAQQIIATLRQNPRTTTGIADSLGISVQNVSYHLDRLCETDLVTTIGTSYSEKGRKMDVYALATEKLILRLQESTT